LIKYRTSAQHWTRLRQLIPKS